MNITKHDAVPRSEPLDALRAFAAFAVLVGHYRNLAFQDYAGQRDLGSRAFYFVTGFGHQAVIVFFALSGFFVGGSVLRSLREGTWSVRSYVAQRLSRLYAVVAPALALTWLLDEIGMRWLDRLGLYQGVSASNVMVGKVALRHGVGVLLANLVFLQGVAGIPTFGSNGPLWSLSYEFWYYVLFPALCFVAASSRPAPVRVSAFALAIMVAWLLRGEALLLFTTWLLGAAAAWLDQARLIPSFLASRWARLLSLAIMLAGASMARIGKLPHGDVALGLCVVPLLLATATSTWRMPRALGRAAYGGGEISFTVYAFHFPILALAFAAWAHSRMQLTASTFALAAGHVTTLMLLLAGLWWLFERRTPQLRRTMRRWLPGNAA